jgi:hypothetical protein
MKSINRGETSTAYGAFNAKQRAKVPSDIKASMSSVIIFLKSKRARRKQHGENSASETFSTAETRADEGTVHSAFTSSALR